MRVHTRGPWHIHVRNSHRLHVDGDEVIIATEGNKPPVAFLHPVYLSCDLKGKSEHRAWDRAVQEVKANAALIAAAPELLEALKGVLDLMENWHALEGTPSMTEQFGAGRKAIAKAEGGAA